MWVHFTQWCGQQVGLLFVCQTDWWQRLLRHYAESCCTRCYRFYSFYHVLRSQLIFVLSISSRHLLQTPEWHVMVWLLMLYLEIFEPIFERSYMSRDEILAFRYVRAKPSTQVCESVKSAGCDRRVHRGCRAGSRRRVPPAYIETATSIIPVVFTRGQLSDYPAYRQHNICRVPRKYDRAYCAVSADSYRRLRCTMMDCLRFHQTLPIRTTDHHYTS